MPYGIRRGKNCFLLYSGRKIILTKSKSHEKRNTAIHNNNYIMLVSMWHEGKTGPNGTCACYLLGNFGT